VATIFSKLPIRESGFVDDMIREQVELEAGASYLLGKYKDEKKKLEDEFSEYYAGKSVSLGARNEEDLKWSKRGKEEFLLASDIGYVQQRQELRLHESLLSLLYELRDIVHRRHDKLEQISNNYRREMKDDCRV